MTHRRRQRWAIAAALIVLAVVCLEWMVRSDWLAGKLRTEVISAIGKATGGRAEIGSIHFSWSPFGVLLNGVVLHGRESAAEPPLFQAQSVRIRLNFVSLWWRDVNVESVTVLGPETYLAIAPDGSTNLPTPNTHDPATVLMSLHVRHLQLLNGLTRVNERKARYAATGTAVRVLLNFDHAKSGYDIKASADNLDVQSPEADRTFQALSLKALLRPDELRIAYLRIRSRAGLLQAVGVITRFTSPRIDAHLWGALDIEHLLPAASPVTEARGSVEFAGLFSYAPAESWRVRGTMSGRDLSFEAKGRRLRGISLQSQIEASQAAVILPEFQIGAIGASLKGQATLTRQEHMDVKAELAGLTTKRLSEFGGPAWLSVDGTVMGLHPRLGAAERKA